MLLPGELADTVGVQNPFRYKGYYYDNETGMYYLKSRYYDAEIKRFICADGYFSTGVGKHDCNMFLYCNNNPIMNVDVNGYSFISFVKKSISFVKDIVGAVSKGISISGRLCGCYCDIRWTISSNGFCSSRNCIRF